MAIQQGYIQFIKSDSKFIYNVAKDFDFKQLAELSIH